MTKLLRCKTNGFIFEYNERLASFPEWEEVTEQQAYPERFSPVDLSKREVQVDITIPEEVVEAPVTAPPELIAEASRAFGGPKATRTKRAPDAPSSGFNIAGLEGAF